MIPLRDRFRRPTGQDQPDPRHDAGGKPGQGRQCSLGRCPRPPSTPRFGPCVPSARLIVPDEECRRIVGNQVGRDSPDTLGAKCPQRRGQVNAAQEARGGHHTPVLEPIGGAAHGLDGREDRGGSGDRLLVGVAQQRRHRAPPTFRHGAWLTPQAGHVARSHLDQSRTRHRSVEEPQGRRLHDSTRLAPP